MSTLQLIWTSYRAIIDKCDLHHGLEDAILDSCGLVALLHLVIEVLVQPLGLIPTESAVEVGLVSLFRGCQERELRDWKEKKAASGKQWL
jgi:hypothetical protein